MKKAGIVLAVTTASLLAVSPLAFATGKAPAGDCNIAQKIGDSTQTNGPLGILNFNDLVDANVAVPICDNNINVQVVPILSGNTQSNG